VQATEEILLDRAPLEQVTQHVLRERVLVSGMDGED
jgi:hypothetical protein